MKITPLKTPRIEVHDDFFEHLFNSLPDDIAEESVLIISSKIISLCEGSVESIHKVDKDTLIKRESDMFIERNFVPGGYVMHTFKNNMVIPSAGIDASNTGEYYALLPKNAYQSAKDIHTQICERYKRNNIGIIITDSRSTLLRRGVVGYALAYFGFNPLYNYRGHKDLYNREMNFSQSNFPDSLAAAGVLIMGEGAESTPIVIATDVPRIEFGIIHSLQDFEIEPKDDIFMPFFSSAPWKKNQG